jgi:hypothetical protein
MRRIIRRDVCTAESTTDFAVLFRTRYMTLWRSEIRIRLLIDAEALDRRWRRFCLRLQYVISNKVRHGFIMAIAHACKTTT